LGSEKGRLQIIANGTTRADGEVSINAFSRCLVTEIEIEIAGFIELELRALDWLYRTWLPSSGYAPATPAFEVWNGRPFAHGTEHFELRAQPGRRCQGSLL